MRFLQFIAVGWLILLCIAPAHAEKRVALVIGNGAYRHADKLGNPVNDARGMREALTALGFDVTYGEDLDLKALVSRIGQFAGRAEGADVALVYFAGHGATFGDVSYVVPVDAEFTSLDVVPYELVTVEKLIGDLRRAKGVRIAILDACRDNVAEQALKRSRGGPPTRGLAPMPNPSGLIVAYATQHGATAADSAGGGNSPFTAAILRNIATPGLDMTDMFRKVGRDVDAATGGRQRPEISISMYDQYVLVPGTAPPPGPGAAGSEVAAVWRDIQNTTNLAVIEDFILHYGNAPVYGSLARAKRAELMKVAMVDTPPPLGRGSPLTAAQQRGLKRGELFRECENCPEMVVVPAGKFTMGSPKGEAGRADDEGPQHTVTIGKPFAVGKLHVTRDQFAAFVQETGQDMSKRGCSWRSPGFEQGGSHPVVCVSWDDAKAYAEWVAKKTGKPYRLLSEAEWEYAARGRTSPGAYSRFWFGEDENDLCRNGNGADQKARDSIPRAQGWEFIAPCNDGYAYTSPAGHYAPNAFGLYDMFGNAWQWTEDCYYDNYNGAPADGSAWTSGTCNRGRVARGGSWNFIPAVLRAADRGRSALGDLGIGFRVARTLNP